MAQAYFITRGHKTWVDQWITEWQGKYLPFDYNGEKGALQIIIRPIQLWEIAYPAEHRSLIMNTLFAGQPDCGLHQSDWKGKFALNVLRKSLGAKPIQPWDLKAGMLPMTRQGMSVMGIGEREDKINYHPVTGVANEGI